MRVLAVILFFSIESFAGGFSAALPTPRSTVCLSLLASSGEFKDSTQEVVQAFRQLYKKVGFEGREGSPLSKVTLTSENHSHWQHAKARGRLLAIHKDAAAPKSDNGLVMTGFQVRGKEEIENFLERLEVTRQEIDHSRPDIYKIFALYHLASDLRFFFPGTIARTLEAPASLLFIAIPMFELIRRALMNTNWFWSKEEKRIQSSIENDKNSKDWLLISDSIHTLKETMRSPYMLSEGAVLEEMGRENPYIDSQDVDDFIPVFIFPNHMIWQNAWGILSTDILLEQTEQGPLLSVLIRRYPKRPSYPKTYRKKKTLDEMYRTLFPVPAQVRANKK